MNKKASRIRRGKKAKAIIRSARSNRPRLVVFRSASHIYSQIVVQAENGNLVLASCSSVDKQIKPNLSGKKCDQARLIGKALAERALAKDISDVAFDRAGYLYHGRVKALAEGAREGGLNF